MSKPNRLLLSLATLALSYGLASAAAQQASSQQAPPSAPSAQQPNATPQNPPTQTPDQTSSETQAQTSSSKTFAGTVVKSGDKYILQTPDGTAFDVDHQELLKRYEGKQVQIKGTLDPDGKTIHIAQ